MFFFSSASPTSSLTPYLFNLMFFSFSISKKGKPNKKQKQKQKESLIKHKTLNKQKTFKTKKKNPKQNKTKNFTHTQNRSLFCVVQQLLNMGPAMECS